MKSLQNAVFTLVEERPSEGRLYGYVTYLIKTFDQAYLKITNALESGGKTMPTLDPKSKNSLLDQVIDDGASTEVFDDPTKAKEASSDLVELIADVKAENKEKRDTEAVYEGVSAALRELQGLTVDNDTAKIDSIKVNSNR
ncbi:MAG: hypothetical protein IPJ20_01180 [Flammeovirgaceae bacterium]|nr:hypothetical protein [Flammeovirgaceae bacterium]